MNSAKLWYQKEVEEIFREPQTSEEGLTTPEAESRLQTHGLNKLPEKGGNTIGFFFSIKSTIP